jgi:hypothetical protein
MRAFDEVMIVNPYDPSTDGEGERLMFGHYGWPGFGYYADPYAYAAPYAYADPYGYADGGYVNGYGYADPYAYADPYYGYGYGYADPYGYAYAAAPAEFPDAPAADFAQDDPSIYGVPDDAIDGYGGYGCNCGVGGYGQTDIPPADSFAQDDINGYADPYGYGGYVAERPPRFNAGCPLPVNVGIGDDESVNGYEGYVPTADVNASCSGFRPGPASPADVPDTFRPLW